MSATGEAPRGATETGDGGAGGTGTAYQQMQRSPEFVALRKRWRGYIFLMSGLFLAWFLVYVLLADFAHDVVNTRLGDTNFTVGLLLGLLQFVSTFLITMLYVRFADKNLDPEAEALRRRVEESL
jgi:uncharacterized membrane protein (DUF485 family)